MAETVNKKEFVAAIIKAINEDELLYDQLPGDGRDDYILGLLRGIILRVAKEF